MRVFRNDPSKFETAKRIFAVGTVGGSLEIITAAVGERRRVVLRMQTGIGATSYECDLEELLSALHDADFNPAEEAAKAVQATRQQELEPADMQEPEPAEEFGNIDKFESFTDGED